MGKYEHRQYGFMEKVVRFFLRLVTRAAYRIKVDGLENISFGVGVILVSNHVSWVDALILNAVCRRPIRFLIDRGFYDKWWLRGFAWVMRSIAISEKDTVSQMKSSLREAREALNRGEVLCVFAEGAVSRTGMLGGFKSGFEVMSRGCSNVIVPVYIGGFSRGLLSYYDGKLVKRMSVFPHRVSVYFGKEMSSGSSFFEVREKVSELSCKYFDDRKSSTRSLGLEFIRSAKRNWLRKGMSDTSGRKLSFGKTLCGVICLAEAIESCIPESRHIGILLPASVGGALANLSVTVLGRIPVNLNYVTSERARLQAVEECGINNIITSREFLAKSGLRDSFSGLVYIEDLFGNISKFQKIQSYFKSLFFPAIFLMHKPIGSSDEVATIVFSSGSSGRAKGVMLSHHNLISNIESLRMVIHVRKEDGVCAVLPFFHSFGLNCGLWLPMLAGISVSYVPNPLEAESVGNVVESECSTIFFAPPTFLLNYLRRVDSEKFKSLRLVVGGAEKLKSKLAESFYKKFGIMPYEGYGATELSPVVCLNLPDVYSDGVYQPGNKPGSVGHPLPGIAVKVVDIESGERVGIDIEGRLMVKGPNVMVGYLGRDLETSEVIFDGWYDTGDVGRIDSEGFVTITDRLSRFSKIGGEMVPYKAIEQVYQAAMDGYEDGVAVTSLPDSKKGEELVVFYVNRSCWPEELMNLIDESDLPNMWKPKRKNYIEVESLPMLGSGKLDILKLKAIAEQSREK